MTDASQQLAEDFQAVIDEAIDFAENCSPEQWESVTSDEGWTVAATIHHVARGNERVAGWIESMRAGDAIEGTTDELDDENADHANEFAKADRLATIELLRTTGADTEAVIRGLSDADTSARVPFGYADGRELGPIDAAGAAVGHARAHLTSAETAAGWSAND